MSKHLITQVETRRWKSVPLSATRSVAEKCYCFASFTSQSKSDIYATYNSGYWEGATGMECKRFVAVMDLLADYYRTQARKDQEVVAYMLRTTAPAAVINPQP